MSLFAHESLECHICMQELLLYYGFCSEEVAQQQCAAMGRLE